MTNSRLNRSQLILWIALAMLTLGILTRIPFRSQILHHWDSVNFALAMEHFDVRLHQPHPPGTFVFYILLGRLFNLVTHDENTALVWLSVILSGLGVMTLYLLAEDMFGRKTALATGLLALVSPLVWFHGDVALSYILEFFWVPLIVYACYRMKDGDNLTLLVSALLLGMAGGVRPNTPVFLFPLWLAAIIVRRYSWKQVLLALVVMAGGVLLWAVPMIAMSGGLQEYIDVMIWWQNQHTEEAGSLLGTLEYMIRFGTYLTYTLGPGLLLLAYAALRALPLGWRSLRARLTFLGKKASFSQKTSCFIYETWDWRFLIMATWLLPGTIYLTFIHLRQPGHTFTIQPGYLLLTGLALTWLFRQQRTWLALLTGIVILNAAFFVAAPTYLFGDQRMLFTTPSWNAIHDYDVYISNRLETTRQNFAPEDTAVLATGRNFRLPDYYLRQYQQPGLSHEINTAPVTLPTAVRNLVILDDTIIDIDPNLTLTTLPLPDGGKLRSLTWDESQLVEVSLESIQIK